MRDLPAKDWISNRATFTPTNHRRTSIQDPHAAPADRQAFTDGWFVDTMPDLNQRNPQLARYLIQNTLWWIEYAGLSGIREDTFGYADAGFLGDWAKAVLTEYPDFAMVGEEWSTNPAVVAHWQRGKHNASGHVPHMPDMMDFPVHVALRNALVQPEGWESGWIGLYEMLANDFLYPDPGALVVFAENHDTPRLLAHVDGDLALWKLGMACLATVRGTPQFYYGSEVLLRGPKQRNDGLLRADMQQALDSGQTVHREYSRPHKGAQQFAPVDGVYVYFRHAGPGSVMVALNKSGRPATLALDRFEAFLQGHGAREALTGKPVALGKALELPAKSATLLEIL